jgi:hypothetical protein
MPFDWREFLIVAHGLRNDTGEGAQRTCLGRAYYYVYNLGLSNARALNFTQEPPGLHKKLWAWCQMQRDPRIIKMGTLGLRMHSIRLDADYRDTPIANLASEVKTQLSRAQTFEGLVAQSNGSAPPAALAQ